jgi:transcriptional regulator with XRE-family HTH domain
MRQTGRRAIHMAMGGRIRFSNGDEPSLAEPGVLEAVIGAQVREHRHATGRSLAALASEIGISKAMLSKIENSQTSCSLNTLARLATGLGVPISALLHGVDPELDAVYTAPGHGAKITGRGASLHHEYTLLGALRGPHKRMDATLVTLTEASGTYPIFQHPGTEILYGLEGVIEYGHGDSTYELQPGGALQFDGQAPHGPTRIIELPIRYLSVIAYGDVQS